MVYYLKYRPQTIGELDSEKVRSALYAALTSSSVPHAFLFTGPKGLGKTSAARIVAKAVNCEHSVSRNDIFPIEPDNKCYQCSSITKGTNIDVLEIDGASNRGIDEIRELRERVHLAPSSARDKIYIIDEVHMLTTEAFNALLKTIEEPPAHVMFLFCTTEPQKVPETILSRCFHLDFPKAAEEEIVHSLKRIVEGEKLEIKDQVLYEIAKIADGSFRDGTKVLEELVSLSKGKKITKELFEEKYHVASSARYVSDILNSVILCKSKDALAIIQEMTKQGIEIKYVIQEMLNVLHQLLLEKAGVKPTTNSHPPVKDISFYDLQLLAQSLSEAYQQMNYTPVPQLPLEIAVVKYIGLKLESTAPGDGIDGNKAEEKNTINSLLKKRDAAKIQAILKGNAEKDESKKSDKISHMQADLRKTEDEITSLMENLIYKVKPNNHSIAGVLRGCVIKSVSYTQALVVFAAGYKFHKERLEERKSCEIIEKALKEITGKQLKISVILKN